VTVEILLIFYPGECKSLYIEDVFTLLKILNTKIGVPLHIMQYVSVSLVLVPGMTQFQHWMQGNSHTQ